MALCFDVIVDADFRLDPLGVLVSRRWQRLHRRTVDRGERLGATARQLLERPTIQIDQEPRDRRVELTQREELAVAKAREDPSLHHEYAHLNGRFIFCVIWPRR